MEVAANKALFWAQEVRNPARYTHVDSDGMCSVVGTPWAALVALLPNTSSSKWKKRWGDRRQDGRRTPLLLRAVILATAGMAADGVNILESGEGECANLLEDRCSIT